MDTKVWICSSCFKSACSGERVLLLGNRSGLVETDIKSLHKLSEELHQYKPVHLFHSFWHSSVFLTFIGPIIIICLFFLLAPCFLCFFQDFWGLQVVVKQNALSPIPPAEHEPIDSQLCVPPLSPCQQEVARYEPAPIYPKWSGCSVETYSLSLHDPERPIIVSLSPNPVHTESFWTKERHQKSSSTFLETTAASSSEVAGHPITP